MVSDLVSGSTFIWDFLLSSRPFRMSRRFLRCSAVIGSNRAVMIIQLYVKFDNKQITECLIRQNWESENKNISYIVTCENPLANNNNINFLIFSKRRELANKKPPRTSIYRRMIINYSTIKNLINCLVTDLEKNI